MRKYLQVGFHEFLQQLIGTIELVRLTFFFNCAPNVSEICETVFFSPLGYTL